MQWKGKVFSVFIGLSKVFDKVDNFIMGNVLLDRDPPIDIVVIVVQNLRNQKAKFVWNGKLAHTALLMREYIDFMICEISEFEIGCKLRLIRLSILAYADDIVITGDTQGALEILYHNLSNHLKKLKLIMNTSKTK